MREVVECGIEVTTVFVAAAFWLLVFIGLPSLLLLGLMRAIA